LRLLPGACDHVGLPVYATFGHTPEQEFADARDGSLAIWADAYGVAFEAALPWSWGSVSLAQGVRANNFREVSCCWDHGRWSTFADEAEGNVETARKAKLVEISIVPVAACLGTGCWLDDEDPADLPPHLVQLRAMWHAGRTRPKPKGAVGRGQARARPSSRSARPARSDPLVDRIVAGWRPKGWAHNLEAFARVRPR
jgi:hypothetical protein